jgi:L-fuconate dehydratase
MVAITSIEVLPIAAPPTGFGGDARNIAQGGPTYANATLEIVTDDPGLRGVSIIFTNGHGLKEMCDLTRDVTTRFLLDRQTPVDLNNLAAGGNLGKFSRWMLQDSDYGWLGAVSMPRMAIGAVSNALWDLVAKIRGVPGWQLIVDMQPEEFIEFIDFEHICDVVPPAEALAMLRAAQPGKQRRIEKIYSKGLLAYNTAGWSGISNAGLVEQTKKMIRAGWPQIKIKIGATYSAAMTEADRRGKILSRENIDRIALQAANEDAERMLLVYQTIWQEDLRPVKMKVAVDSNQVFDTRSAIVFIKQLAQTLYSVNPAFKIDWFEEPTNQHSAMGHVEIQHELNRAFKYFDPPLHVPLSTGEHGASPVTFKDLLHAPAFDGSGNKYAIDVIQMDYSRVAGIGDNLAILLLAQKARMEGRDVRICPHSGGIGLCEGVRNIQAIKEALFGSTNNAGAEDILEFVAEEQRSVHEGVFENPAIVNNGYYQMPKTPGVGVDYTAKGKQQYRLPDGAAWQATPKLAELAKKFMLTGDRYQND